MQKINQPNKIVKLVERAAEIELEENEMIFKQCNFFNRGFCSKGTSCKFEHPLEICEQYEHAGICVSADKGIYTAVDTTIQIWLLQRKILFLFSQIKKHQR